MISILKKNKAGIIKYTLWSEIVLPFTVYAALQSDQILIAVLFFGAFIILKILLILTE